MSLDLGELFALADINDAPFQAKYQRLVKQFGELGGVAEASAAGVGALDESLVATSRSAAAAATSVTRTAAATRASTAAEDKAAMAARQHATAVARVSETMAGLVGTTQREQAATLRAVAAQERYDALLESGTATTRQLASAQAGLIAAQRGVAASQRTAAASTEQTSRSMHGLLGTVRDLGLIFGGIEIAKKTVEFVGAGKELTTALNSVQAAAQATDAQMGPVRAQVIGLGKDLRVPGATAIDAAHAIDDLVRSGMTLPRAMAAARSALLLASVTNTDMARSSRVLGDALDEFQLPASAAAHVASMLGAAATSTAGGLETVFEALQYSGTRARSANVPMSELLASIVDLSKAGLQGTTIGTGLAMAISKLASPSSAGAKALRDLGIEAFDAEGKFKGLPYIVAQVFEAQKRMGSGSKQFLHDITQAFGARAANAIAAFAGKGVEGLDRVQHRIDTFDLQKAADQMNRGFSAAMRAVRKEATAAGIDLYQGLEPKVVSVAHWFGEELPRAGHAAAAVFGGPLHAAFVAVGAIVEAAGAVLKPVIDLLDSPVGSAVATGVLAMWAAFKGFEIAVAAGRAIREAMIGLEVRATNGLAAFRAYGAGVTGVLDGNSTQAAATSAVMRAEFAQIEAAALEEAAAVDRAAAVQAEAYATLVAASDDATATMIANSQNAAAAAEAQAAASAESAATAAAAADAAAADIDAAGEAAAVGWAGILGPIGLVAVGVAAAASAFGLFGSSAKSNAADVDALTAAIQRDNDALGANTRQVVAHALATSGALDAAHTLGLSLSSVTDAALHGGPALDAMNLALGLAMVGSYGASKGSEAQVRAARKLSAALNDQNGSVQKAVRHAREEAEATAGSTTATKADSTAKAHNATATNNNAAAIRKLIAADMALISAELSQAQSQDQFLESVRSTTQQLKSNNGSLSTNTAHGLANRDALLASVQAALSLKDAQDKAGGSVKAHTRNLAGNIASLRAAAIAAGADKGEVDKLLTSLHATPKEIRSTLSIDDKASAALKQIQTELAAVHNKDVYIAVHLSGQVAAAGGYGALRGYASGGQIVGGSGPRADDVPIMASGGEHMMSAAEVAGLGGHGAVSALRAAGRAGRRVMGFAAGGAITRSGKDWMFDGQRYASQRAAENAQARAGTKQGKLDIEIRSKDIPALLHALTGTTSALIAAERTLSKAAKDAGLTHTALARVAAAEKHLNDLSRQRNAVAAQLGAPTRTRQTAWEQLEAARQNYQGEQSTVAGNITGGFDLSQAGRSSGTGVTLASIEGDAQQQRANAELFNKQLAQLQSLGLGKQELQNLAEKGFAGAESSTVALLGASRAQIRDLNGNVAGLGTAAGRTGTFTADLLYGADVRSAQKRVDTLTAEEHRIDTRMTKLADQIITGIGKGLHIDVHIGGEKIKEVVRHEVHVHGRHQARAVHLQGGRA